MNRQPLQRKTQMKRVSSKAWWPKLRAKLKVEFERCGIVRCEACAGTFALGFAHAEKRRFITTLEQQQEVALLCQYDHDKVEVMHHALMAATIRRIIADRETPVKFIPCAPKGRLAAG